MRISVGKGHVAQSGAEVSVLPVFEGKDFLAQLPFVLPLAKKRAERFAQAQDFSGKAGQVVVLPSSDEEGPDVVVCVGMGERQRGGDTHAAREMGGHAVQRARALGFRTIALDATGKEWNIPMIEAFAEGVLLADYAFSVYKQKNGEKCLASCDIFVRDRSLVAPVRKVLENVEAVIGGVTIARDLVNIPAHDMTPERLSEAAMEIAKASRGDIVVRTLDKEACAKEGMGAFLAVAQGAERPPLFIELAYTAPRGAKETVALVGKGVTFDSGGLSLKPADGMMTMKCDMAGAAAVLGVFAILAKLRPKIHVRGYIAATENMPSGGAIRPGDVVKTLAGTTVEILNTDAEGRLTLADAMTYALREKPDVLLDLATLTGACMVALGEEIAGLMSNHRGLAKQLLTSAQTAGEKLWELPLEPRYKETLKSDIADLRNIATTRYGGSLTAGLFLEAFVPPETPWAHLDIAGPAFAEKPLGACLGKGGTGYGVRTLWQFLQDRSGKSGAFSKR